MALGEFVVPITLETLAAPGSFVPEAERLRLEALLSGVRPRSLEAMAMPGGDLPPGQVRRLRRLLKLEAAVVGVRLPGGRKRVGGF